MCAGFLTSWIRLGTNCEKSKTCSADRDDDADELSLMERSELGVLKSQGFLAAQYSMDELKMPQLSGDCSTDDDVCLAFAEFVAEEEFPCAGAKAALATDSIDYLVASDLAGDDMDQQIAAAVAGFAEAVDETLEFFSLVVLFPNSPSFSEQQFEAALWSRLEALHKLDKQQYSWDSAVSDDPASPQFSFSIGGRAFYIVGLHPGASRKARQFQCAALVFNAHSQFERLRSTGRYDKIRQTILDRDVQYSGSVNPMLAVHGTNSEARQYSGRAVADNWVCPFSTAPANPQPGSFE